MYCSATFQDYKCLKIPQPYFFFLTPSTISSSGTLITRNPNQKPLMKPWNSIGDYWLLTAPDFPPRNIWTAKKANHTNESNKSFDTGKLHCGGNSFEFPSKGSLPWLCPTWGLWVRLNEFWREVLEFSLFSTSSEATSPSSRTHPVCQFTVWGPQVASFRSNKTIELEATHAQISGFETEFRWAKVKDFWPWHAPNLEDHGFKVRHNSRPKSFYV